MTKKRKNRWQELQERRGFAHNHERGQAGNRRGRHSEDRVEEVLGKVTLPWLVKARKATTAEDHQGIEFVCELDVGEVYLQVKSSKGAAEQFMRRDIAKTTPIAVIIVSDAASQEKLLTQVCHRLTMLREELQCGSMEAWLDNKGMVSSIDCALKEAINNYGPITKESSRSAAGDIAIRLRAWVSRVLGLPSTRELTSDDTSNLGATDTKSTDGSDQ